MVSSRSVSYWWLLFSIPLLLGLALLFLFFPFAKEVEPQSHAPLTLDPNWYTVDTARGEDLKNLTIVGNCHLCHAYWVPIPRSNQTSNPRFAHSDVQLNHGSNKRCYNCHHIADRNKFTADDGSTIMTQIPEKLCARCHGLVYNDWEAGTHGKWTGKMKNPGLFERTTYSCTECHNPHDPVFQYKKIAPPPIWPDKYIRTHSGTDHNDPMSNYLIHKQPQETF